MSHETLVFLAKTFAPIWMMGFFVIVVIRTYNPKRRSGYDHAARSILAEHERDE